MDGLLVADGLKAQIADGGRGVGPQVRGSGVDLDGEPIPHWPGATAEQSAYNAATDTWTAQAVHAPPSPPVENMDQMLDAVVLGQGVAFLPASYANSGHRGLSCVPVSDISPSTVVVAWPQTCRSQAVAAFVRAALDTTTPSEAADLP